MGFAKAVRTVLGRHVTFSGRATRAEFWWWLLALALTYAVLVSTSRAASAAGNDALAAAADAGVLVVQLGTALPSLAVLVRRLHDTGRSGWYYFVSLIPLVGVFVLFYYLISHSDGGNRYGPHPDFFEAAAAQADSSRST